MWRGIFLTLALGLILACQPSPGSHPAEASQPTSGETPSPSPATAKFVPPNQLERQLALGAEPPTIYLTMIEHFQAIPEPGFNDWLANHKESGQDYDDYAWSDPNLPDDKRQVIYILPLEKFGPEAPPLDLLRKYTAVFFGLEVVVLPPPKDLKPTKRSDTFSGKEQWLTGDILTYLEKNLPEDAYCLLGVTLTDLYPKEEWSYVFGMAQLKKRVGVYSLARYDPQFFGDARPDDWKVKALERSFKVLAHETCHMLGMRHCIYFNCLMNGSNNLLELDLQSSFLCPVCLRKLELALQPNLKNRYRALRDFYEKQGMSTQVDWLRKVLD